MKPLVVIVGVLLLILSCISVWFNGSDLKYHPKPTNPTHLTTIAQASDVPATSIVAENLDTPWGIALLPDGRLLVTERFGRVSIIDPSGEHDPIVAATISNVKEIGEGGLLGIALDPEFALNHYVYLYYTYSSFGDGTLNRVVRMEFANNTLKSEKVLVDYIPGAVNHNGGRIKFGPDGFLYIATGDAQNPSQAQVTSVLGGKILRVTPDGNPAPGNPFANDVYSYGHRNIQGLAWDAKGNLWATEHGRSGSQSGLDELNLIQSGANYGWPIIEGNEEQVGMVPPVLQSGATKTWAPSGMAYLHGSLYFAGLRGSALYKVTVAGDKLTDLQTYFLSKYGRIRDVEATETGLLYITTSNKDGRGKPQMGDDKIILVNPEKL